MRTPDDGHPRFTFIIHEHGTTIGAGKRRRDLRAWECLWEVPSELVEVAKTRYIIGTSKSSQADAVQRTEALVEDFLRQHGG